MSNKNIYGEVPDKDNGDKSVVDQALGELDDHFSNTINGSLKSKNSEYDPENGK